MSETSTSAPSDALNRLKIRRGNQQRPPSALGRLFRFLVFVVVFFGAIGGVVIYGQSRGWIPAWERLLESFKPRPEVQISIVSVETGRQADASVVATGFIESRQQARIGARATGRIESVHVEEGAKVKLGDTLAILEHADLDASLAAVEATAARARSELQEQEVEIQRTQKDFERAEKSYANKTMTMAEYDTARFQRDAATARKDSLEAAIRLSEARVQEAKQLRENMFVRAPFAGTVISKDAEVGESIMPGGMGEASGRGSVVTIADLEHLEVDCDVKEDFISRVKADQEVEIAVDAVPDRRYRGKVRKVIPMGDRARATVKVKVEILDSDENLFPDMSSTVYFLSAKAPVADVNQKPRIFCSNEGMRTAGDQVFAWTITNEQRLKKVTIRIGEKKEDRTEILEGLSGGEKVVVSEPKDFREGMLVKTAQ
ncbi:MAG: efflux RND transporter periplasmic adaptor subunit [Planctomycetaceae bacterium]